MKKKLKFLSQLKKKSNYFPCITFDTFNGDVYACTVIRIKTVNNVWRNTYQIGVSSPDIEAQQLMVNELLLQAYHTVNFGIATSTFVNGVQMFPIDKCQLEEKDRLKQTYFPDL